MSRQLPTHRYVLAYTPPDLNHKHTVRIDFSSQVDAMEMADLLEVAGCHVTLIDQGYQSLVFGQQPTRQHVEEPLA
jgi:hypothetical protein